MAENIYNGIGFSTTYIEYKKIKFFQACDWGKHSLEFKLHKRNRVLSKKKALTDFEVFKYAINNLYCGKPIHEKAGVDFEDCYTQIEEYIKSADKIKAKDLCDKYSEVLKNKFIDNHFHFLVPMDKNNPLKLPTHRNYLPYFTGVTVEKSNGTFMVVSSECEDVKIGDVIKDTGCMFETLPQDGKKRFLVGCRLWEKKETMEIVCNDNLITVKLHLCRVAENENRNIVFSHYKDGKLDIVRTNTFDSSIDKTTPATSAELGRNLKNCDTIIFDMHHNGGGNSTYSAKFFKSLNSYCEEEPYSNAELTTPFHKGIKSNSKEWIIHNKRDIDSEKAEYNGKVVILMDYYCASSAEETINFTKSLKNTIRIGTNTNGCNCFTNLWVCILPESHMAMFLPNIVFFDMFEEGKGFEPDYWLDTTEPLQEVINWLNNIE